MPLVDGGSKKKYFSNEDVKVLNSILFGLKYYDGLFKTLPLKGCRHLYKEYLCIYSDLKDYIDQLDSKCLEYDSEVVISFIRSFRLLIKSVKISELPNQIIYVGFIHIFINQLLKMDYKIMGYPLEFS